MLDPTFQGEVVSFFILGNVPYYHHCACLLILRPIDLNHQQIIILTLRKPLNIKNISIHIKIKFLNLLKLLLPCLLILIQLNKLNSLLIINNHSIILNKCLNGLEIILNNLRLHETGGEVNSIEHTAVVILFDTEVHHTHILIKYIEELFGVIKLPV